MTFASPTKNRKKENKKENGNYKTFCVTLKHNKGNIKNVLVVRNSDSFLSC